MEPAERNWLSPPLWRIFTKCSAANIEATAGAFLRETARELRRYQRVPTADPGVEPHGLLASSSKAEPHRRRDEARVRVLPLHHRALLRQQVHLVGHVLHVELQREPRLAAVRSGVPPDREI